MGGNMATSAKIHGAWRLRALLVPALALGLTACASSQYENSYGQIPSYSTAKVRSQPSVSTADSPDDTPQTVERSESVQVSELPTLKRAAQTGSSYSDSSETAFTRTETEPPNIFDQSDTEDAARETQSTTSLSEADVAARIKASRADYFGSCPCPYDSDRAGRSCGARSVYSRAGAASVLCYTSDIRPASGANTSLIAPSPD
jgi:hypothetical protein